MHRLNALLATSFVCLVGSSTAIAAPGSTQTAAVPLEESFLNPPPSTQPRCYWYWMDGHISKEGITRDLEAMKRVGIGSGYIGVISGQSGMKANPQPMALTDDWWKNLEHAIREGGRLGVDIGLFNSPGWSQSGGPWVKPEQSMRYVVLPETRLSGPQHFEGKLPAPNGAFQDVAVLAFPAPEGDDQSAPPTSKSPKRIQFDLEQPYAARSLTVHPVKSINVMADLQVSDDGQSYRSLVKFPINRSNLNVNVGPVPLAPVTVAFAPTTAKFWRLEFSRDCEPGDVKLSPAARVGSYAEKSLLKVFQQPLPPFDFYTWPKPPESESTAGAVPVAKVVNLSKQLAADGTLKWDVPAGDWIVLRATMVPTGTHNAPAPKEATGLEVDKMNRAPLQAHFDSYIGEILRRIPADQRKALKNVVADSYEMGPQTWTDGFADIFQKRYGYNPLPRLPVLTGRVVGSPGQSDRFLWDLRRLVADRVASEYVGGLHDLCERNGLRMWLENYGHWGFPGEFLQYGGACHDIGGEFWVTGELGTVELRAAASSAHTHDKTVVWAEAFTGGPAFLSTPASLKARGDWAFCEGINQFVLHVYIHQPWEDKKPGINAWFGTEFNRHNTWFEQGKAWIDYLRRCSVMLQAGQPVADVAYFITEDAPKMTGIQDPALPPGRDFDYINAEVIERDLQVKDGKLVLPQGVSYQVLVLPKSETMRPALLKRIRDLVDAGANVLGAPPSRSPSLENFPDCDAQVRQLAAEIWGENGNSPQGEHRLGKGRVFWGKPLKEVLDAVGSKTDFECATKLGFKHRRDADKDIYFVANPSNSPVSAEPVFRVDGRLPELWWPDSGKTEYPAVFEMTDGRIKLPLNFGPAGSVFVVFRDKAAGFDPVRTVKSAGGAAARTPVALRTKDGVSLEAWAAGSYEVTTASGKTMHVEVPAVPQSVEVSGPWEVTFPGATPDKATFEQLVSWANRPEDGIRYFSGQATYKKTFDLPDGMTGKGGLKLTLDLGSVRDLATVRINGAELATLWNAPWEVDITGAAKPGRNTLEIVVSNTWHNRLVGDAGKPADQRATFLSTQSIKAGAALQPAGLLGPVTLCASRTVAVSAGK